MKRLFNLSASAVSIFLLLFLIFEPVPASASPGQALLLATLNVNTLVDENDTCAVGGCSLREAIMEAAAGDTIAFGSLSGTINLTNGQITINKNLTISGPTTAGQFITVDANNLSRVFETTNGSTLNISNITIRGGNSTIGGGIRSCATCTVSIYGATFTSNVSTNHKTGSAVHSSGTLTLTNSTISGNSSVSNNTSSICNDHGSMYIVASTITNNLNIPNNGAALVSNGATYVRNSIIANSESSPDCETSGGGTLTTQGYNFIRNLGTACTITGDQSTDHNGSTGVLGPDPLLGPLQNSGGNTFTHSPLWNSPAKDIIPFSGGACNTAPAIDQREQARPQPAGGLCDSGSVEVTVPIVTFTPGETSFPELGGPVLIDPGVTVQDTDSPDFNGGALSIQVVGGGQGDLLTIEADSVITVSGPNVYYNGTLIANFTGGSSFSMTFNLLAGATPENTQVLLRHIAYQNTLHNPPPTRQVEVVLNDGDGGTSAPAYKTIRIVPNNETPTLQAIPSNTIPEAASFIYTAAGADPDLPYDTLTYTLEAGYPSGASIHPATGVFSWTPTETQGPGVYALTVRVTDNGGLYATGSFTLTVSEVNQAPILDPIGDSNLAEGTDLTFTASVTDPDVPANNFSYSITSEPGGAVIDPYTGLFSWTPSENQGPGVYTFTVWVLDNGVPPLGDSQIVHVAVDETNQAPLLEAVADQTTGEDQLLSLDIYASDPDLPANSLTYALQNAPTGAAIDPASGLFAWTPAQGQGPATYAITVTVTDDGIPSLMDTTVFQVAVVSTNHAPVLAFIADQVVDEGDPLSFTAAAADTDIPADTLTFSLTGGSSNAAIDPATGELNWTPSEAEGPGVYAFTLTVTDNGSPTMSDSQIFQVMVGEVNQAPVLAAIGNQSVNEGSLLTFTASAADADLPTNSLTFSLQGAPSGASIDPSTGVFTWTPAEVQGPQDYTVTIVVMDNGIPAQTDEEIIAINVTEVNTAPVLGAVADIDIPEGSAVDFTLTAADADLPVNVLTFDMQGLPPGAAFDLATGVFHWIPSEDQGPATYVLTATVTDNGEPILSDSDVFSIIVGEVNQAPVLSSIPDASTPEMQLLTFTAAAADADLPANTLIYSLTGAPAGASIDPTTGVFTWTPTESQGPESYTLTVWVHDNGAPQMNDSQVVNIAVSEVNLPPLLDPISDQSIGEGTLISLTATASDPDLPAQTLTFSLVNPPAGASINPSSGAFSWTPSESQGPLDYTITVQVSDGPLTDTEVFVVTVNEVNQAPTIDPISDQEVDEGALLTFTAVASDLDEPANVLTFSLDAGAPDGAAINPATGVFSWTPGEAQGPASYVVTVRVTDNGSPALSATVDVNIVVAEVNSAPVLDPIADKFVRVASPLTFTVTAADPDLPANTLTFTLGDGAPIGAAIDPVTGEFDWTPSTYGTFTITVRVTDSGSPELYDEVTFQVFVNAVVLYLPVVFH